MGDRSLSSWNSSVSLAAKCCLCCLSSHGCPCWNQPWKVRSGVGWERPLVSLWLCSLLSDGDCQTTCLAPITPSLSLESATVCICHLWTVSPVIWAVDIVLFNPALLQFLLGPIASTGRIQESQAWGGWGEAGSLRGFVFWPQWRVLDNSCHTSVFSLCPKISAPMTGFSHIILWSFGQDYLGHKELTRSLYPTLSLDHRKTNTQFITVNTL